MYDSPHQLSTDLYIQTLSSIYTDKKVKWIENVELVKLPSFPIAQMATEIVISIRTSSRIFKFVSEQENVNEEKKIITGKKWKRACLAINLLTVRNLFLIFSRKI